MIGEFILNIIFQLVEWMLAGLPEISFNPNAVDTSTFMGIVRCVLYMLPLGTVNTIIGIIILISSFRIFIAIVKTIWDMLPIV